MNRKGIIAVCALALCTVLGMAAASALTRENAGANSEKGPGAALQPIAGEGEEVVIVCPGYDPVDRIGKWSWGFEAQYIRTDGYHDGVRYPMVKIIRSTQELNDYYEANKDRYNLGTPSEAGFANACRKYDDAYFKDHILLMVLTEAGSGSVRYQVRSVVPSGEKKDELTVSIDVIDTGYGTCDMAEWHILIEPAAGVDVADETHVRVETRIVNPFSWQEVTYARESGRVTFRLPEDWMYDVTEPDQEEDFCIRIGPKGYDSCPITIRYYGNGGFGVCGTGLTQEKVRIGGYEGWQGTYDGRPVWDYIALGTAERFRCVIFNDGFDASWWEQYGADTAEILNTLQVLGTALSREEAIAAAEEVVTVPYDLALAGFDNVAGTWTVEFYREDTAGGDQTVTLDALGTVIGNSYGE